MGSSVPCLDSHRFIRAACLALGLVLGPMSARADDELPPGIDLARLSVLHSVRVMQTDAPRIFVDAEIDSAGTTPGMLGRGICLTLFMQYFGESGGVRLDLESALSIDGSVLSLRTCQGRASLRGFAADLSNQDVFSPQQGFEHFGQRPALAIQPGSAAGKIIGIVMAPRRYNDDTGSPTFLESAPEGLRLDESTYDSMGRLARIKHRFNVWREKLAPQVYAALGDAKQQTSSETREIRIERDDRGRIQQVWMHRSWNRFDASGKQMKGDDAAAAYSAPRELLASIAWDAAGNAPQSISNGRDETIVFHRTPDGRQLTISAGDKRPIAVIDYDAKGAMASVRDSSGERTWFNDAQSGQLLAYLPPSGCLHVFQAAGGLASERYKTEMRLRCPKEAPRLWEASFSRKPGNGILTGQTRVIDAKGSRTVNTVAP